MTKASHIQIKHIFNSRRIILEQLKSRNFDVSNYELFSINELNDMFNNNQMDMLLHADEERINEGRKELGSDADRILNYQPVNETQTRSVYVKYHIKTMLKRENIEQAIAELFDVENVLNRETDQLIIITKVDPNQTLTTAIKNIIQTDGAHVTIINIHRLQFNILNHVLVPKHEVLSERGVEEFKQKYEITDLVIECPKISQFDPVAVAIGMRPGQVCRILRNSPTSIESVYYRVCIP